LINRGANVKKYQKSGKDFPKLINMIARLNVLQLMKRLLHLPKPFQNNRLLQKLRASGFEAES
jgi:hypothetical protein